jgi:hypothetical protein
MHRLFPLNFQLPHIDLDILKLDLVTAQTLVQVIQNSSSPTFSTMRLEIYLILMICEVASGPPAALSIGKHSLILATTM